MAKIEVIDFRDRVDFNTRDVSVIVKKKVNGRTVTEYPSWEFKIFNKLWDKVPLSWDWAVYNNVIIDNSGLKIAFYDIECDDTDPSLDFSRKRILSCAFYDSDGDEYFVCKDSEAETLKEIDYVFSLYDLLVGWNSENFDFPLLVHRGLLYNINFNYYKRKQCDYIKILDKFHNIRSLMSSAGLRDFSLDSVGKTFAKAGKIEIYDSEEDRRYGGTIVKLYNSDREKLKKYNVNDCKIVAGLEENFRLLETCNRLSEIVNVPIFDVVGSIAKPVEMAILRKIYTLSGVERESCLESLTRPSLEEGYEGALVYIDKPGIYENVLILDFKSLYPNLIRSFNVSFETLKSECTFSHDKVGILPSISDELQILRKKYKESGETTSETGVKLLNNSMYGYFGGRESKFRNVTLASSITRYARELLDYIINQSKESGLNVIYGDTDSVFIADVRDVDKVRDQMQTYASQFAKMKDCMRDELVLDKKILYKSLILVSKKKYVGWDGDKISGKGIELVRSDYTIFTKRMLDEFLRLILIQGERRVLEIKGFLYKYKRQLYKKEVEVNDLAITTKISKLPTDYKSYPVHLSVAMDELKSGIPYFIGQRVSYIITGKDREGEVAVSLRSARKEYAETKTKVYDSEMYWKNKVWPVFERILELLFARDCWSDVRDGWTIQQSLTEILAGTREELKVSEGRG